MLYVIASMRVPALVLSLYLCTPVWATDDTLQVYVCESGQIRAKAWDASVLPAHAQLIRSGNAYWVDGRVDQPTASAMFEGAGIWAYASTQALFAKVRTKTASSVLSAIATTESERNGRPWPWTINFQGKSFFFDSKTQAVSAAKAILRTGTGLFDVGLMQVNWHFHGHRFDSLEAAFDPLLNIQAADQIVQEHLKATGSVTEAIGRYHSKTGTLKSRYLVRVLDRIGRVNSGPRKPPPLPQC